MGRLNSGENITYWTYESGTYATQSGTGEWLGLVTNFEPADSEGVIIDRHHGTATRNADTYIPGPRNNGGTVTFRPQDFRMLMFALGTGSDSIVGSPAYYSHVLSELESDTAPYATSGTNTPFASFVLETGQIYATGANLVRKYAGCCVDTLTLTSTPGEPLSVAVDFIAQSCTFSSGAMTLTASDPATRPYLWSDTQVHFPSGTKLDVKTWELMINNNIDRDGAHICNGSRVISVPHPTERGYSLTLTMDGESTQAARIYGLYQSGGNAVEHAGINIFNIHGNSSSGNSWIALSGCVINDMVAPNPVEGINEWSLTLLPKSSDALIEDDTVLYNGW